MAFDSHRHPCSSAAAMAACGPLRTFVARSALAWAWALALALARVAAGAARRGLILERSGAERADCPVVLARGSGRRTHCVHFVLSVRTTAAKMMTKCAARTDPRAALLGAPEIAPAGPHLPRRWVFGVRYSGPRRPHSDQVAGSGRRCVRRSGIKEEPAGRGTAAEPNAPSAWSHHTTPPVYGRSSGCFERPRHASTLSGSPTWPC